MTILTDAKGRPLQRPNRADYTDTIDYIRAVHTYNDAVAKLANEAFSEGWRRSVK